MPRLQAVGQPLAAKYLQKNAIKCKSNTTQWNYWRRNVHDFFTLKFHQPVTHVHADNKIEVAAVARSQKRTACKRGITFFL